MPTTADVPGGTTRVELSFSAGTLDVRGLGKDSPNVPSALCWDARVKRYRAPALNYASVVLDLVSTGTPFDDRARQYTELGRELRVKRQPRPFQKEAVEAWQRASGRGVVVLPTGAGKSHVALLAIELQQRSTLVVAPTLDLVRQWYDLLRTSFGGEVGLIGGGEYDLKPLTVTTYDSAYLHMENIGNRFGFVVFDECHHLPGPSYSLAARFCLAPYRLGLSATPERADGREDDLTELVGITAYCREVTELSGEFLAPYDTVRVDVLLSPEERELYQVARAEYVGFLRKHNIQMNSPQGFGKFIMRAARSDEGRKAMASYRRQRELAFAAPGKLDRLDELLDLHREDRTIVFTQDNNTAYRIARRFLIPIITHQTKVKERSEILQKFSEGSYRAVVTSKVLNEGVDVPDASVAIVVSGSGSVREHVQRLGRILRHREDKHAVLYELVSKGTTETSTSDRRRAHVAYR